MTGEPHPGLARRIESLVRRAGLDVQNRATRPDGTRLHLGFLVSPARDAEMQAVSEAVSRLSRVDESLCLGVYA